MVCVKERGRKGRTGCTHERRDEKGGEARASKCVSANQRFGVPIFAFLSY